MKKLLKKALKPQKSFEVWANENNVEFAEPKQKRKKRTVMGWSTLAASLVLIVAVILPFAFPKVDSQPPIHNKIYSAQDAIIQNIEKEELFETDNILLFDEDQIEQIEKISKDIAKDDESIVLSITLDNCLISTRDKKNAFYINYKIRLYKNYAFFGVAKYSNLKQHMVINNTSVMFEIIDDSVGLRKSLLTFSCNNMEYFLEVKGFEDITEITVDSLNILLNELLKA